MKTLGVFLEGERRFPDEPQIQEALTSGAVNAIDAYGTADDLTRMEAHFAILQQTAARFPDEAQIQLGLAIGALGVVLACKDKLPQLAAEACQMVKKILRLWGQNELFAEVAIMTKQVCD